MMKRAAASLCCILALLLVAGAQTITPGGGGGGGTPPGGFPTFLQYNVDGTNFGGVAGSAWDGTTLTVPNILSAGDLTGGTINQLGMIKNSSTSGTICAGTSCLVWNTGGTFGNAAFQSTGTSGATLGFLNGNNVHSGTSGFTGAVTYSGGGNIIDTVAGALSSGTGPAASFTGAWISGGTTTTTKPLVLIEPTGATSNNWNTNGTGLGVNCTSASADAFMAQRAATTLFEVNCNGNVVLGASNFVPSGGNITFNSGGMILTSPGSSGLRFGAADSAAPSPGSIIVQGGSGTNINGPSFTLTAAASTGTGGTPGDWIFRTYTVGSGTTVQGAATNAWLIKGATQILQPGKGYTVASLPACAAATFGWSFVTDATAPTYRGALIGGGAVVTPVFCDATSWTSH